MANRITIWCSSFCSSALSAVFWSALPSPTSLLCIALLAVIFIVIGQVTTKTTAFWWHTAITYSRLWIGVSGALAGVLWMASVGHSYLSWQLPKHKIQQDVTVLGQVVSGGCLNYHQIDNKGQGANRLAHTYKVSISQIDGEKMPANLIMQLRTIESHPCIHNQDTFSALVRIKPAYGSINPVGFNFQQYLVSQNVVATGYIKNLIARDNGQNIDHHHGVAFSLNAHLIQLELQNTQWWQALLLGNRQALTPTDWQLIQRTGTAHLFSISGMHLGIIAATTFYVCCVGYLLVRLVFPITQTMVSIRQVVLLVVLVSAFGYAYISGMALPVMRAYLLLLLVSVTAIARVAITPFSLMVMMVFFCLLIYPLSILQASFYLSIGAVVFIALLNWRYRLTSRPWYIGLVVMQFAISVAMLPLTLMWFGSASLIGIIANLLVVPIITFLLPIALSLLFTLFIAPSGFLYEWASTSLRYLDGLLSYVLKALIYFEQLPFSHVALGIEPFGLASFFVAVVLFLLPVWRSRWLCIAIFTAPLLLSVVAFNDDRWFLHVFDAGQGTALAITKGKRTILIDTGPAYEGESRIMGDMLPLFLAQINASYIDMVVISHNDMDHAGGVKTLQQWLPKHQSAASWFTPTNGCRQGTQFRWQGLEVRFLWPLQGNTENNNNTSCVVKIFDANHSLLLPGDIERSSEYALIKTQQKLSANVLLSPHHGSSTSSTAAFIEGVSPDVVIHTQGYENRWKFPTKNVYQRYQKFGATQFTTSEYGYIRLEFSPNDIIVSPLRRDIRRRWYLHRKPPRHLTD
ncbi:DNA internalization-related competence protein ComEC/Rec2 [Alteromonas sp. 345S023]|uniref:DNA internalization-related competence protein ComEC/Rec2 n=1 Tax=Alteromonas profundi TaxID=2696062 RepID=A0A7X5LMW6_9ALTE|nr:DNA internalization-related competence protein ComEC/Rec2 [Alteromonas profundi]NDV91585.1 DNA internalization-related competence protein ComEC/Rec2 [Alteromonas profundi]